MMGMGVSQIYAHKLQISVILEPCRDLLSAPSAISSIPFVMRILRRRNPPIILVPACVSLRLFEGFAPSYRLGASTCLLSIGIFILDPVHPLQIYTHARTLIICHHHRRSVS